jgi:hypothetical protein
MTVSHKCTYTHSIFYTYRCSYVDYGEDWFKMRPFLGPIPLHRDLGRANALYRKYMFMVEATKKMGVSDAIHDEVWDIFIRNTTYTRSRVLGSFHHHNPDELTLLKQTNADLKSLRRKQAIRTREWLQQHGTCGDHLRADTSTLRQAGRGAFATRNLPKGTIVAHLPLIHIPERRRFDMYKLSESENDETGEERHPKRELGKLPEQLLLNYCYGHRDSTLLLCPYGPIVNHVNHNQTLVNVRIQWADPARGNQMSYLLEEPLETGLQKDSKTAKLAFEMIALRDIAENEEVRHTYIIALLNMVAAATANRFCPSRSLSCPHRLTNVFDMTCRYFLTTAMSGNKLGKITSLNGNRCLVHPNICRACI